MRQDARMLMPAMTRTRANGSNSANASSVAALWMLMPNAAMVWMSPTFNQRKRTSPRATCPPLCWHVAEGLQCEETTTAQHKTEWVIGRSGGYQIWLVPIYRVMMQ